MTSKLRRPTTIMILSPESLILQQTENYIATNKPTDLAVHPSDIHRGEITLMHYVKELTGKYLYPVHRIDRAVSGIVLFAFDSATAACLRRQFDDQTIRKQYLTIVRGHINKAITIDHAVNSKYNPERKEALTILDPIAQCEVQIPSERYPTSRFSLVNAYPKTGRWHQIRLHCSYIGYPIVGDVKHGDGTMNKIVRESLQCKRILLHSHKISFLDESSGSMVSITCEPDETFIDFMTKTGLENGYYSTR